MNKLKGEKYKLLWKESPDFVRLASKLNCTIVPFAAVGGKRLPASSNFHGMADTVLPDGAMCCSMASVIECMPAAILASSG